MNLRSIVFVAAMTFLVPVSALAQALGGGGLGVFGGGGIGGGGISPPAGDIGGTTGSPTVVSTHLSSPLPASQGGSGVAYGQPAANSLGTINNTGTATCNFTNTYLCFFTLSAGNNSFTIANPTAVPAAGNVVTIAWNASSTGIPTITWGTVFLGFNGNGAVVGLGSISNARWLIANTGTNQGAVTLSFLSDGTNLTLFNAGGSMGNFDTLNMYGPSTFNGSTTFNSNSNVFSHLTFSGDNTVASMDRMAWYFDEGHETALTANESLGTFKTVKAVTIENIEADIKISPTCSVSEVITCFDCGTSAGACTSGQTATISTTTIASGATRQSVDQTITTAPVAAAHYVSCLITAGTCTVSDNAITMMVRPQ